MWAPKWVSTLIAAIQAVAQGLNRMSTGMDNLTAAVAAETTVEASAVVALNGLGTQLSAALKAGDTSGAQALADQITNSSASLASAIAANTIAAAPPSGPTGGTGATGATGA